jgi:hypothetical protein
MRQLSVCQLTPASSSMTARNVASDLNRGPAIVAFSAHTDRCHVLLCKPVAAATSAGFARLFFGPKL